MARLFHRKAISPLIYNEYFSIDDSILFAIDSSKKAGADYLKKETDTAPGNQEELEQQQTEAALRVYEEKFAKAFRCNPNPISIARLQDGQYLEVNDAWLEASGYQRDAVIGRTDLEINIWADTESRRKLLNNFLKTGTVRSMELKFRHKNGKVQTGLLSADILNMGEEPCILAVIIDISERIRIEEALRSSEHLFSIAFNASPVAMTISSLNDGRVIHQNERTRHIFGYNYLDGLDHIPLDSEVWHEPNFRNRIKQLLMTYGFANNLEMHFKRNDGEIRLASISVKLIEVDGETCVLSVISDITEQRLAEEALRQTRDELEIRVQLRTEDLMAANQELQATNQELFYTIEQLKITQQQLVLSEKMASLGSLVAGVAHEVSTPIGVAVTTASQLKHITRELAHYATNDTLPPIIKEYLEDCSEASTIILKNLERAAALLRSFKQVSVDQSNEVKRVFNVKDYLDEILLSLHPRLKNTRLTIHINCDNNLQINSFPGALAQIITNLIMNSLLHAYEADLTGQISIDVIKQDKQLTIIYADDGKGMKAEVLHHIFDPFFTTKRAAGGTGLGLHIVYNIINMQLGGSIECSSEPNKGTCFSIRFPL